jgi:hypothetical protein
MNQEERIKELEDTIIDLQKKVMWLGRVLREVHDSTFDWASDLKEDWTWTDGQEKETLI